DGASCGALHRDVDRCGDLLGEAADGVAHREAPRDARRAHGAGGAVHGPEVRGGELGERLARQAQGALHAVVGQRRDRLTAIASVSASTFWVAVQTTSQNVTA